MTRRKRRYRRRRKSIESKLSVSIVALIAMLTVSVLIYANVNRDIAYEYTPTLEVEMEEETQSYNGYNMGNVYFENGIAHYEDEQYTSRFGVDVSSHNSYVDWQSLKDAGVTFAMIRVGYRGYDLGGITEDAYFEQNINGALNAGIDVGVYFFSQAINEEEAAEEAKFVIEKIHPYSITMPVVYDLETYSPETNARANNLSREQRTSDAVVFLENIKNAGYTPMMYASTNTYADLFVTEYLTEYPFWVAEYNSVCNYPYTYRMWQYADYSTVYGLPSNIDLNIELIPKN